MPLPTAALASSALWPTVAATSLALSAAVPAICLVLSTAVAANSLALSATAVPVSWALSLNSWVGVYEPAGWPNEVGLFAMCVSPHVRAFALGATKGTGSFATTGAPGSRFQGRRAFPREKVQDGCQPAQALPNEPGGRS